MIFFSAQYCPAASHLIQQMSKRLLDLNSHSIPHTPSLSTFPHPFYFLVSTSALPLAHLASATWFSLPATPCMFSLQNMYSQFFLPSKFFFFFPICLWCLPPHFLCSFLKHQTRASPYHPFQC